MYFRENPVLQRELISNLRMTRGFLLLFAYVAGLGMLVYAAWPANQTLDLARPEEAQKLVNLFFFGQYILVSLMTPSFAAGAITGERERESYEMLLASPLRLTATPVADYPAPPMVGQHTREVLRERLGFTESDLDALSARGVI